MLSNASTITVSLIGGVIPALVWLLFWLREDRKRPEPKGLLALTFFVGMLGVPLVIPFQQLTLGALAGNTTGIFLAWAAIEEIVKFGAAYVIALRKKDTNEPVDALIYIMTAALGFTALENALFIFDPLSSGNVSATLITGTTRFIGASLLHTLSSAVVGISIALSFYKNRNQKRVRIFWGLITAIALHTIFNLLIIREQNGMTFATFGFVWIAIVIVMLFFEKVKRVYPVNTP
jgi:RsiW-degrading membrane proteinase PrsW (M82 family)